MQNLTNIWRLFNDKSHDPEAGNTAGDGADGTAEDSDGDTAENGGSGGSAD
jgi:hypothetical protein